MSERRDAGMDSGLSLSWPGLCTTDNKTSYQSTNTIKARKPTSLLDTIE